jgi:radical SAM enzyme (TIGR01210 family)
MAAYPERPSERDRWIMSRRPPRSKVDPWRPSMFLVELERAESGQLIPTTTLFLTNRECPWRCLMCDLWKNTLTEEVPPGAIPAQIDYALERLKGSQRGQVKLYNSGSFFDPRAIPPPDHLAIAQRVSSFERVVVECHPALVNESARRFQEMLTGKLEVAMGLETVHPEVLQQLNKRMTLSQFKRAADFLRHNDIAWRAFILVQPPFLDVDQALHWAKRSIDFAFDCGATAASLIPTRAGNGALEALAEQGAFSPPQLSTLEAAATYGVSLRRGRVFADLWDLERFSTCPSCWPARLTRLREMNHTQTIQPAFVCPACGS